MTSLGTAARMLTRLLTVLAGAMSEFASVNARHVSCTFKARLPRDSLHVQVGFRQQPLTALQVGAAYFLDDAAAEAFAKTSLQRPPAQVNLPQDVIDGERYVGDDPVVIAAARFIRERANQQSCGRALT